MLMKRLLVVVALIAAPLCFHASTANAQVDKAWTVTTCGTAPSGFSITGSGYPAGGAYPMVMDVNGNHCTNSSGDVGPAPHVNSLVPLDISTVTTGGTAVTALNAGHRTAGGFLLNPIGATINLCINEQATASGTTSSGALTCITPGQTYFLTPSTLAVSVITSDSSHPFAGQGLQ